MEYNRTKDDTTWDYVKEISIVGIAIIAQTGYSVFEAINIGYFILWALDILGIVDVSDLYVWIDDTAHIYENLRWPIDYVKERALEFTGSE